MLGLAKALAEASSGGLYRPGRPSQSGKLFHQIEHTRANPNRSIGIHFGLKPSNILVNRPSRNPPSFHFNIADFGLAHIKDLTRDSDGARSRGGDDAYAPPESAMQGRSYDIWSLGCIFLEILTFLVLGHKGIGDLDKARSAPSTGPERQTPCFWEPVSGGHPVSEEEQVSVPRAKLKEGVQKFLDKLHQRACESGDYSPKEQRLITNTITMIKKMLRIEANTRPTAKEVVWWLEQIGRGYKLPTEETDSLDLGETPTTANQESHTERDLPTTNPQDEGGTWWEPLIRAEEDLQLAEKTDVEMELEPSIFRSMRGLLIRSNRNPSEDDSNAILQVFTEDKGNLRFVVSSLNLTGQEPLEQNCRRQHVHLMPQYAFRKTHHTHRRDAGIRLVWSYDLSIPIMRYDFSGELNDLRKIHGALLGQEIYHTIQVKDVKVTRPRPTLWKTISRKTPKQDELEDGDGPFTVQLWREKQPETSGRVRKKARACRLVIYFSSKLYVIPFHQYFRFPPRKEILDESLTVLESGTVHGTKQTFQITVLRASEPPHILPTFPLDGTQLEDLLTKQPSTFRTTSVEITFRAHADLYLFWNDYRVLKEDWLNETGVKPKGAGSQDNLFSAYEDHGGHEEISELAVPASSSTADLNPSSGDELPKYSMAVQHDHSQAFDKRVFFGVWTLSTGLLEYIRQEFSPEQGLGASLVLFGRDEDARCTDLESFLTQNAPPTLVAFTLQLFRDAAFFVPSELERTVQLNHDKWIAFSIKQRDAKILRSPMLLVSIQANSKKLLSVVGDLLSNLIMALQPSSEEGLEIFKATASETNGMTQFDVQSIESVDKSSCWHPLFPSKSIIYAPIKHPNEMKGLEIPFKLMVELCGSDVPISVDGGVCLAGVFTLLTPIRISSTAGTVECVQWHLTCILPSKDSVSAMRKRLWKLWTHQRPNGWLKVDTLDKLTQCPRHFWVGVGHQP